MARGARAQQGRCGAHAGSAGILPGRGSRDKIIGVIQPHEGNGMRKLSGTLLVALLLPSLAAAAPLQITGRVLHPPKEARIELRPWAVGYEEALRRLKGEAVSPIASARPQADGSFAIRVPESGFYSGVARAEGHLAMERFVRFLVEETEVPQVELPRKSGRPNRGVSGVGASLGDGFELGFPEPWKEGRRPERRAESPVECYQTGEGAPEGAMRTIYLEHMDRRCRHSNGTTFLHAAIRSHNQRRTHEDRSAVDAAARLECHRSLRCESAFQYSWPKRRRNRRPVHQHGGIWRLLVVV